MSMMTTPYVKFPQNSSLLTFRRVTSTGPAMELRYDRGGGHLILKRQ
jgi:hypothetical protein